MTNEMPSLSDIGFHDVSKFAAAMRGRRRARVDDDGEEDYTAEHRAKLEGRYRQKYSGVVLERHLAALRQLWKNADALKKLGAIYFRAEGRRIEDAEIRRALRKCDGRRGRVIAQGIWHHRTVHRVAKEMLEDERRVAQGLPSVQQERDAETARRWRQIRESVKPKSLQDKTVVRRGRRTGRRPDGERAPRPGYRSELVLKALFSAGHSDEVISAVVEMDGAAVAVLRKRLMAVE